MNKTEIKKQLAAKKAELEKIQMEYDRQQYSKQMYAFVETLWKSNNLLRLIKDKRFTREDSRYLAQKISDAIFAIYMDYQMDLSRIRQKRANKNIARKERRKHTSTLAPTHNIAMPVSPVATTITSDKDVRQY